MTDTFRALCAELVEALHARTSLYEGHECDLVTRARAALEAQPEPQGFTPDHVNLMCFAFEREPWATWLRRGGCLESAHCELSDLMLAVLARWGRPAIEPVSVSERLPGPEDCDAEGQCWLWRTDGIEEFWELVIPSYNIHEYNWTSQWKYTHWLPHWALPVPGVEGGND
jgi:hypothetical protein